MCGIAGFWGAPDRDLLVRMTSILSHRGPDDDGFSESAEASLGMRRLSIIDLQTGSQPQSNEDGTVELVYNGEIYNFRELRAELEQAGHRFATRSDTEAVVHAYEEWGPECFARFNGMWAVAIFDRRDGACRLVLARDHFGIKPLYWTRAGGRTLFASEIKALLEDPAVERRPNDQAIYDYLAYGLHDHSAATFFEGIFELPAASYAIVDDSGWTERAYWRPQLTSDGSADPVEFRRLFTKAVERRLVADVPVGTCLSGGLDSSSIVCLMSGLLREQVPDAASMGDRLKTFSAVFDGDPIDERAYIDIVLERSGAEANFVRPTSEEFVRELGEFVWHLDEPVVSTGPYAQWCVMRLARTKVTVLLDGQAGDELLAGYVPYQAVYLRQLLRQRRFGEFLREAWMARDVLRPHAAARVAPGRRVTPKAYLKPAFVRRMREPDRHRTADNLKRRLLEDLTTFSLPSLIRYEDRNSMAHSVEARLPYLDQELVEWILRQPERAIIRGGWSRAVLRQAMAGILPDKIRKRRWKVGFTTPEMRWLRRERPVFQSLFRSPAFCSREYWDGPAVADAFTAACEGRLEDSLFFWRVINVELWLRVFFGAERSQIEREGDREFSARAGSDLAQDAFRAFEPNAGRHLFTVAASGAVFARAPLRSRLIKSGDNLAEAVREACNGFRPESGDVIALSEKSVAIAQGRSSPVAAITPTRLARLLAKFVRRTPVGIGISMPETMQLALEEVGAAKLLFAAVAAALTRPLGVKGVFYRVAGPMVASIDGPTAYTIPPYNTHAKRAPADPDRTAEELARDLSRDGVSVHVAIVDVNDLGVSVLGASPGMDREVVASVLRDNPLGQQRQQTPFALIRRVS